MALQPLIDGGSKPCRRLAHRQMADASKLDHGVLGGKTGQMAHIAGLHDAVATAADPQAGHREPAHHGGQLLHRLTPHAAGQQPARRMQIGPQRAGDGLGQGQRGQPTGPPAQKGRTPRRTMANGRGW